MHKQKVKLHDICFVLGTLSNTRVFFRVKVLVLSFDFICLNLAPIVIVIFSLTLLINLKEQTACDILKRLSLPEIST